MSGTNEKIERNLMNKALAYSSNIALAQQGIIDMSDDKTYAQFQLDMDKNIVKLIQVASKEDLLSGSSTWRTGCKRLSVSTWQLKYVAIVDKMHW